MSDQMHKKQLEKKQHQLGMIGEVSFRNINDFQKPSENDENNSPLANDQKSQSIGSRSSGESKVDSKLPPNDALKLIKKSYHNLYKGQK